MANSRLLFLHVFNDDLEAKIEIFEQAGFHVVHADHEDLFWPKFIETGRWDGIVIDESVLPHIYVEMASEIGLSLAAHKAKLVLICSGARPALPSSLKGILFAGNAAETVELISPVTF